MTGSKRDKGLKTYDHTAFTVEKASEENEQEAFWVQEELDDHTLEVLAAEDDEDAALVLQFEDAISETIQNDMCSRLSWLQSEINRAKVSTLIEANRFLHEARIHVDVKIVVKAILIDEVRFVAFSEASFASNKTTSSHQGMVIMSCHQKIGQNDWSDVSLLVWH